MLTIDRNVADADSLVAPLAKAGGVWFEGGRQFHLVDSYAGTKTERGFNDVLARGGVVGGTSAGASILGSYLVRGAPSNNNFIMSYPGYEVGFGFLRNTGIDQHVVARERLPDLADSVIPRHKDLLGISEDEGTAWVVRGDTGEIIGRNKAFVYNGRDKTDDGKPFLTLFPGDRYDLAARRVMHRASDESPVSIAYIDSVFSAFGKPGSPAATVLVAQNGKVFAARSYGVPAQRRYMPTTTMPNFALGGLSEALNAVLARAAIREVRLTPDEQLASGVSVRSYLTHERDVPDGDRRLAELLTKKVGSYQQLLTRALYAPTGMHKTVADSLTGAFSSNVDELYRLELVLTAPRASADAGDAANSRALDAFGWRVDSYHGVARESQYATGDGKRGGWVRFPERRAAIIILTDSDGVDAKALADRIADRLLGSR
jgi:cyanophycinase